MRVTDFQSSTKAIAAGVAQTISFNSSDIISADVTDYHLTLTGAGNTLNAIDLITVKASGVPFIQIPTAFYRAYIQRMTNGRVRYPANGAINNLSVAGTAVDWRRFTIPLRFIDLFEYPTEAMRDQCRFVPGAQPTVEILFNTNAVAGTISCGYTYNQSVPQTCSPQLLTLGQMSIAASAAAGKFGFTTDGIITGLGLNTVGLGALRVVLNSRQVYNQQGQPATSATVTEDVMILEADQLEGSTYALAAGTAAQDNSLENPVWVKMTAGVPAATGSLVQLQTLGGWAGAANQLCYSGYILLGKSA